MRDKNDITHVSTNTDEKVRATILSVKGEANEYIRDVLEAMKDHGKHPSRESAIFQTKMEEAVMWACKGLSK